MRLALSTGILAILVGCGPASKFQTEPEFEITLANPSDFARADEAVFLNGSLLNLSPGAAVNLGPNVPHQWVDRSGDGVKETLLIITDLAPGAKSVLAPKEGASPVNSPQRVSAEISVKQGGQVVEGRYEGGTFMPVPMLTTPDWYTDHSEYIRYEGPGIESEEVGYRLYLDWRNGLDVFGKTSKALVLHQVGLDGYQSYHEPSDWGMDVLKVGQSAGIGGFGAWDGKSVARVSEVTERTASVAASGPLYSEVALDYRGWQTLSQSIDLNARLSMTAGSRLVEARIASEPALKELAVTLPIHPAAELITGNLNITGQAWSYIASFGSQAMEGEALGLAIFFKRTHFVEQTRDEHNEVVLLKSHNGEFNYYFGAVWGGELDSDWSKQTFVDYLERQAERLTFAPRVHLESVASAVAKRELNLDSLQLSTRAAHAEIDRHGQELAFGSYDTMRGRPANWEYTMGLLTQAIYEHGAEIGDARLTAWAKSIVDSYLTEDGTIRTYEKEEFNIDRINSGKILLRLYRDTGDERYWLAATRLREQLEAHPKLNAGAYWHKKRYPYQLWLDGVYMAMPFMAEYAVMAGDRQALETVVHEFEVVREAMRDQSTGLYFHAWDEARVQNWADPQTGLSRYFWGRGMGWFAMAIVDTLEQLKDQPDVLTTPLVELANEFAKDLMRFRNEHGVWYQIMDQPEGLGNYEEASASAMFTYFFAKGINLGVLPSSYKSEALQSYRGLVNRFVTVDAQGAHHLMSVCQVGGLGFGRDGSYSYYMSEPVVANDPKGLGPYIMLGAEVAQLLN